MNDQSLDFIRNTFDLNLNVLICFNSEKKVFLLQYLNSLIYK